MGILQILRQPAYTLTWLGLSLLAFDLFYIVMRDLPGEANNMCVPGANLTPFNLIFAGIFSVSIMLLLVGTVYFIRTGRSQRRTIVGTSLIGSILGFFTLFCSFCVLPLAGVVGISSVLSFFTLHNTWFKVLSLLFLFYGLWTLHNKLRIRCDC